MSTAPKPSPDPTPDPDREARILELRRQVQQGEYQVDPHQLAATLIRESIASTPSDKNPSGKNTPAK